jgi:hypothetical protein
VPLRSRSRWLWPRKWGFRRWILSCTDTRPTWTPALGIWTWRLRYRHMLILKPWHVHPVISLTRRSQRRRGGGR